MASGCELSFPTTLDTPTCGFKTVLNLLNDSRPVKVNLKPELYDRKVLNAHVESLVDSEWKSRCEANKSLFNGMKFRLHSVLVTPGVLQFNFGLTCYKDYLATNSCKRIVDVIAAAAVDAGGDLADYLANPLGCGALLLTLDKQFLFIKRSANTGEYALFYDRPGGYAEPELCKDLTREEAVLAEIFNDSIVRELKEELNFDRQDYEINLLGLMLNCESYNTPNLQFIVRSKLTSEQMCELYHQNKQPEAEESCEIKFIPEAELYELHFKTKSQFWSQLTPICKACVDIYFEK